MTPLLVLSNCAPDLAAGLSGLSSLFIFALSRAGLAHRAVWHSPTTGRQKSTASETAGALMFPMTKRTCEMSSLFANFYFFLMGFPQVRRKNATVSGLPNFGCSSNLLFIREARPQKILAEAQPIKKLQETPTGQNSLPIPGVSPGFRGAA